MRQTYYDYTKVDILFCLLSLTITLYIGTYSYKVHRISLLTSNHLTWFAFKNKKKYHLVLQKEQFNNNIIIIKIIMYI